MKIGESIKKARKERGYTLNKLSKKSGVSVGTIHNWEKERTIPNVFILACVADVLKISIDDLIGRKL
jgi:transcriptional regulator with XRE-family HTH domain